MAQGSQMSLGGFAPRESQQAPALPVAPALLPPSWAPPLPALPSLCSLGFSLAVEREVWGLRNPFHLSMKNPSLFSPEGLGLG